VLREAVSRGKKRLIQLKEKQNEEVDVKSVDCVFDGR